MYAQVEKTKENKSSAVANSVCQRKNNMTQGFGFVDNRPEAVTQRKLQEMASSPQAKQDAQLQAMGDKYSAQKEPIQKKENNTGLPNNLKTRMEKGADIRGSKSISRVQSTLYNTVSQNKGIVQRAKAISVTKDTSTEYSIEAIGDPSTFTGGSAAGNHGIDGVKKYFAEFSADDQLNTIGNRTGRGKREESNVMNNELPEYHGGHLLPKEFGGSGDQENVFNQEGGQNVGSWRSFEIAASEVLKKTPPRKNFTYKMKLIGDNLVKE